MKDWHKLKSESKLFKKQPYSLTGRDNFCQGLTVVHLLESHGRRLQDRNDI